MGIEELLNGAELIVNQNSPLKELPAKGLKEFCPDNSWLENKQIEKRLEERFTFINTSRIEKSNNVSLAIWVPELCKAKVLKKFGKFWETIGHHQNDEDWLLPEEVLFLVENCELQLILGDICASVEDCYALLLQEECCTLEEYRVYSYLCRAGLRVIRHAPSVTVTPYEQQVNLDLVLQRHKRSPPRTYETNFNDSEENEVTIIDDDISILSNSTGKDNENVPKSITQNSDHVEVIEIEDDADTKSNNEQVFDCDDDSSDIICISSPSYISTDQCRLWYPMLQKSLIRPIEKIIDLCDDDNTDIFKELACDKLDLINPSKAKVLSLLPDADKGVSIIYSPDSRLLPKNVVPKHSEYKVNLNVRSDRFASFNSYQKRSLMSRMPERNMRHNVHLNHEFVNNPLFRQAEEMQAMAMNMIQTASTLMSAMGSQNPNELWNYADGRNPNCMNFRPRYNAHPIYPYSRPHPYYRFPRRNFRRRYHYDRWGGNRYARRMHESNKSPNNIELFPSEISSFSSGSKTQIVVLSDDEEPINKVNPLSDHLNDGKRKRLESDIDIGKKLKTEIGLDSSSTPFKDSSRCFETNRGTVIKTESEDTTSEIIKDNSLERSSSSLNFIKVDEEENEMVIDIECGNNSSKNVEPMHIVVDTEIECLENTNKSDDLIPSHELNTNLELNENFVTKKISNKQPILQNSSMKKTNDEAGDRLGEGLKISGDEVDNFKKKNNFNSSTNDSCILTDSNLGCVNIESSTDTLKSKITCWEEYKNIEDSLPDVKDGDVELSIKLEECITYGNILTSLQIFKDVDMTICKKKYKIMYDVYLPEASFKKSLKILPSFRVIVSKSSENLPTPMDLNYLKTEYKDQIPFLFSVVFNETIGFYLYDNISLPSIIE